MSRVDYLNWLKEVEKDFDKNMSCGDYDIKLHINRIHSEDIASIVKILQKYAGDSSVDITRRINETSKLNI